MTVNGVKENIKLYTFHGKKRSQGIPTVINGNNALAYYEGEKIVGYTTLEEINREFYTRKDLPKIELDF